MDHLWAPWRMSYVAAPKPTAPPTDGPEDCFLCRGLAETNDRANLILHRTPLSVVVLNKFPYNNGHLLVAPRTHQARFDELTTAELLDVQETLRRMVAVISRTMNPDGFNIGLNLGRAAGAGLPGHLHWHIVPRWNGDTNFMPVFDDTRVIVQSLDALYTLLEPEAQATG
jgi:ATP adenylyltransferase